MATEHPLEWYQELGRQLGFIKGRYGRVLLQSDLDDITGFADHFWGCCDEFGEDSTAVERWRAIHYSTSDPWRVKLERFC